MDHAVATRCLQLSECQWAGRAFLISVCALRMHSSTSPLLLTNCALVLCFSQTPVSSIIRNASNSGAAASSGKHSKRKANVLSAPTSPRSGLINVSTSPIKQTGSGSKSTALHSTELVRSSIVASLALPFSHPFCFSPAFKWNEATARLECGTLCDVLRYLILTVESMMEYSALLCSTQLNSTQLNSTQLSHSLTLSLSLSNTNSWLL
jgi:hypothetical protein